MTTATSDGAHSAVIQTSHSSSVGPIVVESSSTAAAANTASAVVKNASSAFTYRNTITCTRSMCRAIPYSILATSSSSDRSRDAVSSNRPLGASQIALDVVTAKSAVGVELAIDARSRQIVGRHQQVDVRGAGPHGGQVVARRRAQLIGREADPGQGESRREHVVAVMGDVLRVEVEQRQIAKHQPQRRERQREQRDHRREQTHVRQIEFARHQRSNHRHDRVASDRWQQHHQPGTRQQSRSDTMDRGQPNLATLQKCSHRSSLIRLQLLHPQSLLIEPGQRVDRREGRVPGMCALRKRRCQLAEFIEVSKPRRSWVR